MKREYLFYGLGYLVFVLVFMTPLGMAFKRELDEKQTAKVLAEEKRAEAEREKLASEAIKAMMQEYPQRSETMAENEIPKIARGTTGQAKWIGELGCSVTGHGGVDKWFIVGPGPTWVYSDAPEGWSLSPTGVVTVPIDAPAGAYTASYNSACQYEPFPGEGLEDGEKADDYEFEVVCMKVTITAAPSGGSGSGSGSGG